MSLSILIAEDNGVFRDALQELLEQEGYTVSACETGTGALTYFDLDSFDLVIANVIMPEMDGLDFIRNLHRLRPGLKVIAISADLSPQLQRGSVLLGVKATLQKPFSADELFRTIRSVTALASNGR